MTSIWSKLIALLCLQSAQSENFVRFSSLFLYKFISNWIPFVSQSLINILFDILATQLILLSIGNIAFTSDVDIQAGKRRVLSPNPTVNESILPLSNDNSSEKVKSRNRSPSKLMSNHLKGHSNVLDNSQFFDDFKKKDHGIKKQITRHDLSNLITNQEIETIRMKIWSDIQTSKKSD